MRHKKKNLHFGFERREKDDLRNLAASCILYEKVVTTKARAKRVKAIIDKMITIGKAKNISSIRRLNAYFWDSNVSKKIIQDLVPKFKNRNSGFTRVVKIGNRVGDGAPKSMIELLIPYKEKKKQKETKSLEKKPKIKIEKKEEEGKGWLDRAKNLGRKVQGKDTKITTRTTSK